MDTITERAKPLADLLTKAGIQVRGGFLGPMGTGVFTFHGRESATKACLLLAHAFKVKGPHESLEYTKENRGTCLRPTTFKVWTVGVYGPK